MSLRRVSRMLRAAVLTEGAGVRVHRTLGTPGLRHLDPFLLLDYFSSADPQDYAAGFPDHPHRGFVTLTYMLDGHMLHRDSLGNRGDLRSGGAQWMKAASGVIHSEMPQQTDGLMRGFQLWINLPAAEKMSDPAYQEVPPESIPQIEESGVRVRLLSGEYAGRRGPIEDPHTQVEYLDVSLGPGRSFVRPLDSELAAFLYAFEGDGRVAEEPLPGHHLAVLGGGDDVRVAAGADGCRFILVAGRPLGIPIVQYGPFVMSTREEIEQALADYRDGRLVRKRAEVRRG
jgi:redox-sensitive bicupin YhaK (pirin superfamily)